MSNQAIKNVSNLFDKGAVGGLDDDAAQAAKSLGCVCWYTVYGVNVPHAEFELMMLDKGIPEGWIHKAHSSKEAYMAMVNNINKDKSWAATLKKISLGTADGKSPAVHAIVTEVIDRSTEKYRATQVGKVIYNHARDVLDVEWDGVVDHPGLHTEAFADAVRGQLEHYKTHYQSSDVRNNVLDIIMNKLGGFRVRPNGGIYFVGREHADILEGLDEVLRTVSDGSLTTVDERAGLQRLNILDSAKERGNMMVLYAQYLQSELAKVTAGMDEAKAQGKTMRLSSVQERCKQMREIKEKAMSYEVLFETTMDSVAQALSDAEQTLSEHLLA